MLRPLHLADSMEGLRKLSEKPKIPSMPLSRYTERMEKLHVLANKAQSDRDQEEEYVYLHRYFELLSKASENYPEYSKGSEKYKNDFSSAQSNMKRYEILLHTLETRYKEKEQNEITIKKTRTDNNKSVSNTALKKTLKDVTNNKTAGKPRQSITSKELYTLMDDKKESFIVFDVRSSSDFKKSHVNSKNVVNIPDEIISPGVTASTFTKTLPSDIKIVWNKRHNVDKLIIIDWNSSEQLKPGSKIFHLRDAMTKWDPSTNYKCKPLILEGGFEEFLSRYPFFTTNPKVIPPSVENLSISLSLDSFDYPMQELESEENKPSYNIVKDNNNKNQESHNQMLDRSKKPKHYVETKSTPNFKEENSLTLNGSCALTITTSTSSPEVCSSVVSHNEVKEESEETTSNLQDAVPVEIPPQIEMEEDMPVVPEPKTSQINLDELRKVKPDVLIKPPSLSNMGIKHEDVSGIYRIPLKKDDSCTSSGILKRSSSSPNITKLDDDSSVTSRIPTFSRANKPVAYGERADSTYGRTAAGLTGLKNFANNCYMNSILQCLSNTEPLVKELISINRTLVINTQSKTKGRVAQEIISALRNMWSGEVRAYSIKELKALLGSLKEIFKGTAHQDSNEFLIILLEYLHDDLNIPAACENRLDGAKEESGEKAWGEFRRKNCSIIQRLFYGQHRSTVTCSTCNHSSVTFEQFFNLFVPIPSKESSVTLNDCIQLYMSGERISGWKCPVCKDERNATKKFDISRLPPILVIALKRFTHEEDSWLQKKENLVTYPLENLDMERFIVIGSEQRYTKYNLYAMSTHTGTLRAGHYKAICKNYITNKWYLFDDQTVETIPLANVRNNPEVYILFYNAVLNT